jgi:hypothetical protein
MQDDLERWILRILTSSIDLVVRSSCLKEDGFLTVVADKLKHNT